MTITDTNIDDDKDSLPEMVLSKEFNSKYHVYEVLGKGVSSTVRRCVNKVTKVEFAVKIIDLTSNDSGGKLHLATMKEIEQLRVCAAHPNIINLIETFDSEAFIFLVFELCKNGELFDYLTEVVTLSEKKTRILMKQLILAVEYIHSNKMVHRDLKPENILLDDSLNVKLSDFGFITEIKTDTDLMDLCGTPGYLAPETLKVSMFDNSPGYGRPVDMWACGVILYTLLVGCPPFWHRRQMQMLRLIMEARFTFQSPEWDDISATAKDLISCLLVVDPVKRLTATQALDHEFFKCEQSAMRKIHTFREVAFMVIAVIRIQNLQLKPPPLEIKTIKHDPYSIKAYRRLIDAGAFRIYGHWVKKGDTQNRAALFENRPIKSLKIKREQFAPYIQTGHRTSHNY